MKLYYASSTCSLAVRIIMHELKIPCEYESVNLKTKETETGLNYLTINAKGSVPVLQTEEQVLTECAVILQFLADKYNATDLLPPVNDPTRYQTLEWLNFVSTDLHRYCSPLFWSKFSDDMKQNLFRPILNKKLHVVDQHLQNNKFLMGDCFTLGDSYLFVILIWLLKLKISLNQWPNLSRYFGDMKQRNSVKQAVLEEKISVAADEHN